MVNYVQETNPKLRWGRVALQNTACANKKTNFVLQPCLKGVGDSKNTVRSS